MRLRGAERADERELVVQIGLDEIDALVDRLVDAELDRLRGEVAQAT